MIGKFKIKTVMQAVVSTAENTKGMYLYCWMVPGRPVLWVKDRSLTRKFLTRYDAKKFAEFNEIRKYKVVDLK
jgi:hypothetical protein